MSPASRRPLNDFSFKLKAIYLPFLVIAFSFIVLYSFLNWVLFIRTGSTAVKEEVLHIWLPMILPWVPMWIWLRPRVKALGFRAKGDPVFVYVLLAVVATAVPTMVAQPYLVAATGELTALDNVHKLNRSKPTRYYTVKNYFIDKDHAAAEVTFKVSGKYNSDLRFALSVACPLYHNKDVMKLKDLGVYHQAEYKPTVMLNGEVLDSAQVAALVPDPSATIYMLGLRASRSVYGREAWNGAIFIDQPRRFTDEFIPPSEIYKFSPRAWLCLTYYKTISNRLSDEDKNRAYRQFLEESAENFRVRKLDGFTYLDRIGHSDEREGYTAAIQKSSYYDNSHPVILEPVYAPFGERNGHKLGWVFGSFGIGAGVWLALLLRPTVRTRNLARLRRQQRPGKEMKEVLALFVPKEHYWVTPVILNLNVGVFLVMVLAGLGFVSFSAEDLLRWGGNFRPYTLGGDWWRLLTCMFLHAGVVHLVMNLLGLVFVGIFLEPLLGPVRLAVIYLVTGLVGSLSSVFWYDAIVSIGASGAVFGLYGVFLALLLTRVFPPGMKKAFLVSTVVFVGYNLLLGLGGGIDNAAHIGGLVSGLVAGFCFYPFLKAKEETVGEVAFEFEGREESRVGSREA